MRQIWPAPTAEAGALTIEQIVECYAYPDALDAPYLRANFVASVDGAASLAGVTQALSPKPDRLVFGLLRQLADVILVGAQTARAENYGGARKSNLSTGVPPRIAVVTATGELDPTARLFTETSVPPLILAAESAPAANLRRLAAAGAEVVTLAGARATPAAVLAELDARGLRRVLCEGGPRLFGALVTADAVDELCLTISPALAGGTASRIALDDHEQPREMRLASILTEDEVLLLRYLRDR
jgi:riboflavin biosynthesis pyrimidine reductase